jgi:hypothetical protein
MRTTVHALEELHQALDVPSQRGSSLGTWRWTVRQRMAGVRDVLVNETALHENEWLAARGGSVLRERNALLGRLSEMGPQVLESEDVEGVRSQLQRLLCDIRHHVQRLHDLAYDEVELELGGSE